MTARVPQTMAKFFVILGAIFSCTVRESIAFTPTPQFQLRRNNQHQRSTLSSLQMCICIHCARVTNCSAYHFVEQQHSQPHINKHPTWEPRNGSPTIQVHIRPDDTSKRELGKMWEEHEEETRRAEEAFAAENNGQDVDGTPLFGSTQYDLTGTTTYEYDVVECEDFVEERDAWVKNMPEEIKIANPHFVPT